MTPDGCTRSPKPGSLLSHTKYSLVPARRPSTRRLVIRLPSMLLPRQGTTAEPQKRKSAERLEITIRGNACLAMNLCLFGLFQERQGHAGIENGIQEVGGSTPPGSPRPPRYTSAPVCHSPEPPLCTSTFCSVRVADCPP